MMEEQAEALLRESKKPEPKSPLNPEFRPALKEPTVESMAGLMYPEQDVLSEDDADIAYRLRNKIEKNLLPKKYIEEEYGAPLYTDISPSNISKEADYLRSRQFGRDNGVLGSYDVKTDKIHVLNRESMKRMYPTVPDKFEQVLRHENTHQKIEHSYRDKYKPKRIKGLHPEQEFAVNIKGHSMYGDLLNEHVDAFTKDEHKQFITPKTYKRYKQLLAEMYPISSVGNYTKRQSSNPTEELFARLVEKEPEHILKANTPITKNAVRMFFP